MCHRAPRWTAPAREARYGRRDRDAVFLAHLRAAGVTLIGLDSDGAMAYLDSDILRNARQIALLNEDGMR